MKTSWTSEKWMRSNPCSKWMKEKNVFSLFKSVRYTSLAKIKPHKKVRKSIVMHKQGVCVNSNSNQCHKIRGSRFGIFSLTPTTSFYLLIKPNFSNVHLPCRLLESGLPLWWSLPPMHFIIVFWWYGFSNLHT